MVSECGVNGNTEEVPRKNGSGAIGSHVTGSGAIGTYVDIGGSRQTVTGHRKDERLRMEQREYKDTDVPPSHRPAREGPLL